MLCDEHFIYAKLPKGMASTLIKASLQAILSCKQDDRSLPDRLHVAEYILLQFANELANPLTKISSDQSATLNTVFEPSSSNNEVESAPK